MKTMQILSSRFDRIQADSVEEYRAAGGYEGLKKAITMKPEDIIEEIKTAQLFGRGGAAYPTGIKWEQAYAIPLEKGLKYMVCNADEGEPGTFKDRYIMDKDPLMLIEGMTIGAYIFGAQEGFIYCRGEYSAIQKILRKAIENAKEAGFLGENILGTGLNFDIQVISGAGAYVCGENTALVESIEGKTGRPRRKPPYIKNAGLNMKPTVLNNVETFACIPWIVKEGGEKFLSMGTEFSGGTKLMCLSGNVVHRGVYEVPFGTTFRELIEDLGGGIAQGRKLKFVHLGGSSGSCFPGSLLDTKICYKDLRDHGLSLGSGAVLVVDDTHCVVDYLKAVMEFFEEESCGKCTPCREGNQRMVEILEKLGEGRATMEDLQRLKSLAQTMKNTSFCGLGQSAPVPVTTLLKHFTDEFEAHVQGQCPSGKCSMHGARG
ncbi:NADH:ubiquinone oxidoreductase, NADH-binding (51 kD) subunit [Desulfitobacterium dehalogenans ATCC 51507]|uniref:NADH:ubiquinone oxidoreductase, NADH-binding (51 kD) subunit n=1 Tax=Desulfitobacterium dehalogenans (strain ATCC 51507 / DSM 9161 / JW/IU-DC1) TaxID=756499 RepID=I4A530_DESDJ|nr:NADH-ubiquinone oxidoreductase-F iron-sulfur binding region domain-containing protein [Desulfitobacterium dehalogenans]AFL99064.1 NADH:ubiquinone oxidoreductase, NADH-binding (51 kD) subunit [Desulfitobacterium dehalogenans ATCC 51507]